MNRNENNDSSDQFAASIRGLRMIMTLLGIWPRINNPRSINCYNFIWYLQSTGLAFQIFGPAAGLIVQRHDVAKIVDNLGVVIPTGFICIKWITFSMNRKGIGKLVNSMEIDWKNVEGNDSINKIVPESKRIMKSYSKMAKTFLYSYLILTIFSITIFVGDSIGGGDNSDPNNTNPERSLPLPNSWYPLDYNKSYNIKFLMIAQGTTSLITVLANASMDGLFIAVTLHLCGQLKILSCFIEGMNYDRSNGGLSKRDVKTTVNRHQELLRIVDQLQNSYNIVLLIHLLACTLTICFLEYIFLAEIEANGSSVMVLLKFGFLCMGTMQTTFAYCFVGDSLTNQSIGIASSIYNSEWYDANQSTNLSLVLVMIRSGKPIEISAAKVFSLSLENFTVLIKTAASYLSVLRAVGINDDD